MTLVSPINVEGRALIQNSAIKSFASMFFFKQLHEAYASHDVRFASPQFL